MGVRHEEVAAFAAGAQSQLSGRIGVCMGTVGPGAIHLLDGLLDGLYDAKKSHAPVLAIIGQVPREEIGSDFFQEVDNDALFRDVAVYNRTITSPTQMPQLLEQAVDAAYAHQGVAVITLPGDLGDQELPKGTAPAHIAPAGRLTCAADHQVAEAAEALRDGKVTLLVGRGARHARDEVLQLAEALQAPMVLTLKGKEGLEHDNPYQVGQSGRCCPGSSPAPTPATCRPRARHTTPGWSVGAPSSTRSTTRSCSAGSARSSTTPTTGSAPRPSRTPWTDMRLRTRSSPATRVCRRPGSPASSR
ncbi:thiamine pyrophosphate-binding protein [Arsenicicoccus dermatophilus]|uniref:thiamine pyrophosphate-binding protein n=1 Tax=Arsenicicoccus dermatophilus TaxID=1076331 RepID=UPI001F4C9900|nr:hypothetical protein [Arsenicicoccus dermatophilus]